MHISRAFDKLAQYANGFIVILKSIFGQELFPLDCGLDEVTGKGRLDFRVRDFGPQHFVKNRAYLVRMTLIMGFEEVQSRASHELGEAYALMSADRDGVGLPIALHLKTVFHIAKKQIRVG